MKYIELSLQFIAYSQYRRYIATPIAIIRRRPHRDQRLVFEPVLEPVHDELMRPSNEFDVVDVVEFSGDFGAE